ncbi:MAG TPA: enolase C-terminal domain-like protein [Sedimentisphaerales bacterium]|nr:enolase C-terminal domain-like protein [Sedimentisphaerales bacterium]
MAKNRKTDIRPVAADLYFIPVETRVPLKFGPETLTSVICARACVTVADARGRKAQGWGETPLSVQWTWPSSLGYQERCDAMQSFCRMLAEAWAGFETQGHPMELGSEFIASVLPGLLEQFNRQRGGQAEPMPHLAALVCCSAFDVAVHDAYGKLLERDVYSTYNAEFMTKDLSGFIKPVDGCNVSFAGKYPQDFFVSPPPRTMPAWHLVGGKDLLDASELTGDEPNDGYPVLLPDWIKRDGLTCLKVKLRGNDSAWDYERLIRVGEIAINHDVQWLTSDFNCTVTEPAYVNDILDRLIRDYPGIYQMILYVEQPFPYDLEKNQIDVHSVSARKPLFMDESAHDWKLIRLGRSLGWTGVALKTCKTQTGALLSLCWAKAHGMTLMVQDLTNPMLAQIPHVRLAAHAGTIMGVETNAMQFYPAASVPEELVHPGLYRRRNGQVDLATIKGPGFGYRLDEIKRQLPSPAAQFEK